MPNHGLDYEQIKEDYEALRDENRTRYFYNGVDVTATVECYQDGSSDLPKWLDMKSELFTIEPGSK